MKKERGRSIEGVGGREREERQRERDRERERGDRERQTGRQTGRIEH